MSSIAKVKDFEWAVIGAGPAGIAAVGKLIDNHIEPSKIAWLDPFFEIGDFGLKWSKVSSNTHAELFVKFLNACNAFEYTKCTEKFALHNLNPKKTCELSFMVEPLKWVTQILKQKVYTQKITVKNLRIHNQKWQIKLENEVCLNTNNIILATGADAKSLSYSHLKEISLEVALNKEKLGTYCTPRDTIAVFGSSHSAILIIRNLLENCSMQKIINFYQSPLKYAVYLEDMILFDNTGLKGTTADWARANLHGKLPSKLERMLVSPENMHNSLLECTQAIYAVGFTKRIIPIEGFRELAYNDKNGIIAPGLFGLGVAYPESATDKFGNLEYRVGLWKFIDYLTHILPVWLQYPL